MNCKLKNIVKDTLTNIEKTRNDDYMLTYFVIKKYLDDKNIKIDYFYQIMMFHKTYGLPSIESITRARRLLQRKYPELRADREVEKIRAKEEERYREIARSENEARKIY